MRFAAAFITVLAMTSSIAAQGTWTDLGGGVAGVHGTPRFIAAGTMLAGDPFTLAMASAKPSSLGGLIVSTHGGPIPFKGGSLYPVPPLWVILLSTDALGGVILSGVWPQGVPDLTDIYLQLAVYDGAAIKGFSMSNALRATTCSSCTVPMNRIAAWWTADDTIADIIGHHDGGWLAPDHQNAGASNYAPGKLGDAFRFDGGGGMVTAVLTGGDPLKPVPIGNSERTLEFWIKLDVDANGLALDPPQGVNAIVGATACGYSDGLSSGDHFNKAFGLMARNPHSDDDASPLGDHPGDVTAVLGGGPSGSAVLYGVQTSIADGAWHHLALTYNPMTSPTMRLYKDGSIVPLTGDASANIDTQIGTGGWMDIGSNGLATDGPLGGGASMHGLIDEVTLWSLALNQSQVQAIATGNPLVKPKP